MDDFVKVFHILKPFGIKGEVKAISISDNIERFKEDIYYYIDKKEKVSIEKYSYHKGFLYIKFKEYDNINQILQFVKKDVYILEKDLFKLPEGEYYIYKLIGFDVFLEDGTLIGKLEDILQKTVQDLYVVKTLENKEIYIPYVDEFIKEIDEENGKIFVKLIEGLDEI